jgi:hypothetical protein
MLRLKSLEEIRKNLFLNADRFHYDGAILPSVVMRIQEYITKIKNEPEPAPKNSFTSPSSCKMTGSGSF